MAPPTKISGPENSTQSRDDKPGIHNAPSPVAPVPTKTPPPPPAGVEVSTQTPGTDTNAPRAAASLFAYLKESGTPEEKLVEPASWLADQTGTPSAEALYRHLEAHSDLPDGVTLGTLRKAGKYTFGDHFEPAQGISQVPAEAVKQLEDELAVAKKALADSNRERLIAVRQRDSAVEEKNELARQVRRLQGGRTHQQLVEAGLEEAGQ
jgi:hypothetical protein